MYVQAQFKENLHYINFLEDYPFQRYSRNPDLLIEDLKNIDLNKWVVLDEIQKIPKILDIVHHLIEKKKIKFIMPGSSARKLKRGSANLLAGRAFSYQLFPLSSRELDEKFNLDEVLSWGSLPKVFSLSENDKAEYLRSYGLTYLREEILQEQLVRNGVAFQHFLDIAALENGKLINYTKIAREVAVDPKTIQVYFQILEDTMVGYLLPAFQRSIRKSVGMSAKFYLFDQGIKRALDGTLQQKLIPQTSVYGWAFEHFLMTEMTKLNSYLRKDYRMFHYYTTAGGDIDFVLTRRREIIAIEVKAAFQIDPHEIKKLETVASALKPTKIYYVSQDPQSLELGKVSCRHWMNFLKELF